MDCRKRFIDKLIGECLSTHSKLIQDNIIYIKNLIWDLVKNNDDLLSKFLIVICKNTQIGGISFGINYQFDNLIKNKDSNKIIDFIEKITVLSLNQFEILTDLEKKKIIKIYERELRTIRNIISLFIFENFAQVPILANLIPEKLIFDIYYEATCYEEEICLDLPSRHILLRDTSKNNNMCKIFACVKLENLLEQIYLDSEPKDNSILKEKYKIEWKLYQKFRLSIDKK